jgi:hypothetical protein
VSDRVSQFILLCEDATQERLARAYLKRCGHTSQLRAIVASRTHGGNVGWVLDRFPAELYACRQRNKRAKTLLIVIIDADHFSVDDRRRELSNRLTSTGHEALGADDPVAVLIPKRNIETWVCVLLGANVTEEEDCKSRASPKKESILNAAATLYAWSRQNASVAHHCVPSLKLALPEWRKIG